MRGGFRILRRCLRHTARLSLRGRLAILNNHGRPTARSGLHKAEIRLFRCHHVLETCGEFVEFREADNLSTDSYQECGIGAFTAMPLRCEFSSKSLPHLIPHLKQLSNHRFDYCEGGRLLDHARNRSQRDAFLLE